MEPGWPAARFPSDVRVEQSRLLKYSVQAKTLRFCAGRQQTSGNDGICDFAVQQHETSEIVQQAKNGA